MLNRVKNAGSFAFKTFIFFSFSNKFNERECEFFVFLNLIKMKIKLTK